MQNLDFFIKLINDANKILITTHIHPDADGIGSQVALSLALKSLGKKVFCVNEKKLDKRYHYLDPDRSIVSADEFIKEKKIPSIDLYIVVDTNTLTRVGMQMEQCVARAKNLLFIDHHPCPKELQAIHCINPSKAATAEIIGELLEKLNVKYTKEIALPLYTAVLIDSSSFRYPTVTGNTHRFIAKLLDTGIEGSKAYNYIYGTKKLAHMQILGAILSNTQATADGTIAWISITKQLLEKYKVKPEDTHAFINHLLILEGVKVACMFREDEHLIRISFRSNGEIDVGLLGQALGGGGHNHSSATAIEGSLDRVIKDTILKIEMILTKR